MDFITLRKKLIEKDFSNMNFCQLQAVTTVNGALLVLAGAGSGKTTVLVNRILNIVKYGNAYNSDYIPPFVSDEDIRAAQSYLDGNTTTLPEGVFSVNAPRAYRILAITFTNKAADELKSRIGARLGEKADGIWAGTFHSVCGKILRANAERIGFTPHFTVYDTDDQKRVVKDILKSKNLDEKMFPVKSVLSHISSAKESLITPEEYCASAGEDYRLKAMGAVYSEYQKNLLAANAMDFDDMISYTVKLLRENEDVLEHYGNKFKYIMVDEYQDTNHAQYELVHLLGSVNGNVCVVGDDDQSIYRFRGATIENILNFEDDYQNAKVIRLEQNYRSTGNILSAANRVIANNKGRKGKNLWTDRGEGERIEVYTAPNEREEARYVTDRILENVRGGARFCDHAVLYRMNAQSAAVENVFARSGVSYRVIGGMRFYERKEIRDVLAYLNLINNQNDAVRLRRIINEPRRGIGETTLNYAAEISQGIGISLFETLSRADEFSALSRAASKLKEFCDMINELKEAANTLSLSELCELTLQKTGYRDSLLSDTDPKNADRLLNVDEFVNTVTQYELENAEPTLSEFLEEIALVSDVDSLSSDEDKVTLMTIHSAKGLEFENVFLIGLEEGIFPGNQSIYGGEAEIEEERRLAYVAITRAKRRLTITNAQSRMLYGSTGRNVPSRFLREIPEEFCHITSAGYFDSFFDKAHGNGHIFGSGKPAKKYSPYKSAFVSQVKSRSEFGGEYFVGQTVEHNTFGKGMILSVSPMGSDTLLEIAFDSVGTKKIMAAYAKLKII